MTSLSSTRLDLIESPVTDLSELVRVRPGLSSELENKVVVQTLAVEFYFHTQLYSSAENYK